MSSHRQIQPEGMSLLFDRTGEENAQLLLSIAGTVDFGKAGALQDCA
jgi:hypothetical protein